jgi:hypothetical protein
MFHVRALIEAPHEGGGTGEKEADED